MGAFLLYWLTKVLVALFILGLAGSAIVVVITFIEDGQLLLEKDERKVREEADEQSSSRTPSTAREAF